MTQESPSFSVLMPAYNAEKYVGEAVSSILNQTFINFEFLIINDGSTDGTEKVIKSFKDRRIRLVTNNKNLGLIATLNKGIELAKGKYIARMDADDVSLPERLERQFEFMEKNDNVAACGTWAKIFGCSKLRMFNSIKIRSEDIPATMFIDSPLVHSSVTIRKSTLLENNLRYNLNYLHCEDYKLWYDLSKFGKLANIPSPLLLYRMSSGQIQDVHAGGMASSGRKLRREIITDFFSEIHVNEHLPEKITKEYLQHFKELQKNFSKNDADADLQKKLNCILYCLYMSLWNPDISGLARYLRSLDFFSDCFYGKNGTKIVARFLFPNKYESLL